MTNLWGHGAASWRPLSPILLLTLFLGASVSGQMSEKMPIPEYFGIYAIDNGQLVSIHEGKSSYQPNEHELHFYSMAGGVDKTVNGTELSSGVSFLIFNPSPSEMAHDLALYKMAYVRNFVQGNLDQALNPLIFGREAVKTSPVNSWLAARVPGSQIGLLTKPITAQPQMIQVVPENQLSPGTYAFFHAKDKWWQVFLVGSPGAPNASDCIDIAFQTGGFGGPMVMGDYFARHGPPEFPEITAEHYKTCGGQRGAIASISDNRTAVASAQCTDYETCFQAAMTAYRSHNWQAAFSDFNAASTQRPKAADPWIWLGRLYLITGQTQQMAVMWDKVLSLEGTIPIGLCHERTLQPCEAGYMFLSQKLVSFGTKGGTQIVFSAPPQDVSAKTAPNSSQMRTSFGLRVNSKNFAFDFFPLFVACQIQVVVLCPQEGLAQQSAVSNYFLQTLPKLAAGASASPAMPPSSTAKDNSVPSANLQLIEQMKSMIAGYEKAVDFRSPLDSSQFLDAILKECQQTGVPPWLLFGQVRFETTFGDPINATVRDGMTFTDGTSGNAHNLFNIRPGSNWTGKILDTGQGGKFRVYTSFDDSVRDYLQVISGNAYRGQTLKQLANTYFPASENGAARVQSYIDSIIQLAGKLGVTANENTVPLQ